MPKFHSRGIERDGACFPSYFFNLAGWNEQKFSFIVNKTSDEPGARNTINMDMGTSNPLNEDFLYILFFERLIWCFAQPIGLVLLVFIFFGMRLGYVDSLFLAQFEGSLVGGPYGP